MINYVSNSCLARRVPQGWKAKAAVGFLVLLAAADGVFWGYLFKRPPAKSTYVSSVTGTSDVSAGAYTAPPPTASPAPSPGKVNTAAEPFALPSPTGRPLVVSIVGDAIATGQYASGPDHRYRTLVLNALSARGAVTASEATRMGDWSTAVEVPSGLDLAVVEVGSTDVGKVGVTAFSRSYRALVSSVRSSSPHAALVCVGTWNAQGAGFDRAIASACAGERGRFVSLQALYANAANHSSAGTSGFYGTADGVEPNDAGHRAIAAAILGAVGVS